MSTREAFTHASAMWLRAMKRGNEREIARTAARMNTAWKRHVRTLAHATNA